MMTEITPEQAVGKKFKGFCGSWVVPQAIITFTDGTFITLEARRDYDGEVVIGSSRLDILSLSNDLLVEGGVFTREELSRISAKRDDEFKAQLANSERDTYERLRKKFEKEK